MNAACGGCCIHASSLLEKNGLTYKLPSKMFRLHVVHSSKIYVGISGRLNEVYTRELSCEEPIEKLYYSATYSPICVYCAEEVESVAKDHSVKLVTNQ